MSTQKKALLAIYAVLGVIAIAFAGSAAAVWAVRILALLAIIHVIEVAVFFKLCREAGGSLPGHLLNVFLFGIIHANELKSAQSS